MGNVAEYFQLSTRLLILKNITGYVIIRVKYHRHLPEKIRLTPVALWMTNLADEPVPKRFSL